MEVEFCPSNGLTGGDGVDLETHFMNLLVVSDTYTHEGIGNCLVVKNGGRCRVFLAYMEYLGGNGLEPEARRIPDMKLILFVPCMHTCEHFHAVASRHYISFDF